MNSDLTIELIESWSAEDILFLKKEAMKLHASTVGILETPLSSQDVEREMRLRTAMKLKLSETIGNMMGEIKDVEANIRDLRNIRGWCVSDESRLESYMYERLRSEKKNQS